MPIIHIIGAGLSGLSAAVRLADAGMEVVVHEATAQAGGRCRSYYDHFLAAMIDNGNHLLLSGNYAAMSYLKLIGAQHLLVGPASAEIPFVDLATDERWVLRPNDGRLAWWIFRPERRVPGTQARDYLGILPLLWARASTPIGAAMRCEGDLYARLWRPFLLAALNTEPAEAPSGLAAVVIRETLLRGGRASRPLIAREGLSAALIDPALRHLESRGVTVRFEHNLRGIEFGRRRVAALDFGGEPVRLNYDDAVVLAVPAVMAKTLVPSLTAPDEFRAIVNAHFGVAPPPDMPAMIGVLNGTVEWIFSFPGRLSVTISGADRLLNIPRETLAETIWREVAKVVGVADTLPPWQIVRERRATFAATPEQNAKRPGTETAWENLVLAGDWTDTGLPATIEGSIRSGERAAHSIRARASGAAVPAQGEGG